MAEEAPIPAEPLAQWGEMSPECSDDDVDWVVNILSPKIASEEVEDSDHALVPWVARPSSPVSQ